MKETKEQQEAKVIENQENSPAASQEGTADRSLEDIVTRPRPVVDPERVIQQGRKKNQPRGLREMGKTRGLGVSERRAASIPGAIEQLEKLPSESYTPVVKKAGPVGFVEDRETVKWAAYGALLVSLVAMILLSIYSKKDFGPTFEYHDLKIRQAQLIRRVGYLAHNSQLEKIRTSVINAQFQLFVRKDNKATELVLVQAKEDLNTFIDALPIEKTTEPKEILDKIDRLLREIRRAPDPLDKKFQEILFELEKL